MCHWRKPNGSTKKTNVVILLNRNVDEDLSAIWRGRGERCLQRCRGYLGDESMAARSPPSPSLPPSPSSGSCTVPLSRGREAAGWSGCLSVTVGVCSSALVSVVVVHRGRDAGHDGGASSCCKVTRYSWTYGWAGGQTGLRHGRGRTGREQSNN